MRVTSAMERHQVPLYLVALAVGALAGAAVPGAGALAGPAVAPVLALLLYATFVGVPFARLGAALRDLRFLATVLAVNLVLVPVVAWLCSRAVADEPALLVGVLLVLLAPCVDYVVVFTGLAGGDRERLLAAVPVLLLVQMVSLPLMLRLMVGGEVAGAVEPGPFLATLLWLVAVPLLAAAATQRWAPRLERGAGTAMVPLMMATLALVVAAQIGAVLARPGTVLRVVPVFVAFAVLMAGAGALAGRLARLRAPARTAVVFSGVTRNSLVVLPLALALPAAYALAPIVVVTQTLVELLVMVAMVRLARERPPRGAR